MTHANTCAPALQSNDTLPTWYATVAIEPRLADLEWAVSQCCLDQDEPGYWAVYSAWKKRLEELVGWNCQRPELQDRRIFDACHDHLLRTWEGR